MRGHDVSVQAWHRQPDGVALQWRADCACGVMYFAPTYPTVEDRWREHVWATTGVAPDAWGDQEDRWQPYADSIPR